MSYKSDKLALLVCEALAQVRDCTGRSQGDVRKATGINMSNYESSLKFCGMRNYLELCEYFGVMPGRLMDLIYTSLRTNLKIRKLVKDNWEDLKFTA